MSESEVEYRSIDGKNLSIDATDLPEVTALLHDCGWSVNSTPLQNGRLHINPMPAESARSDADLDALRGIAPFIMYCDISHMVSYSVIILEKLDRDALPARIQAGKTEKSWMHFIYQDGMVDEVQTDAFVWKVESL